MAAAEIAAQLPALEQMCERLYNSQVRGAPIAAACQAGLAPCQCLDSAQGSPGRPWIAPAASKAGLGPAAADRHRPRLSAAAASWLVQVPQERAQAEQMLRVFGTSTEYVPHCKVRALAAPWRRSCLHGQQAAPPASVAGGSARGVAPPTLNAAMAAPRRCSDAVHMVSMHSHRVAAGCVWCRSRCCGLTMLLCSVHLPTAAPCPQAILDGSASPYAQLLASSSLIRIVTEHSMAAQVGAGWVGAEELGRPVLVLARRACLLV